MAPLPDLDSLIETVRQDTAGGNPLDQLSHAARSAAELEDVADGLLGHFVERCRDSGCTWTQISTALGVSKQAVHKRFAGTAGRSAPTFERFTPRARSVMRLASDLAVADGASGIGTGHLAIALLSPPEALAAQVLSEAGVDEERLRAALSAHPRAAAEAEHSGPSLGAVGFSAAARHVLALAVDQALTFGHNYIGTEHMLLGMLSDDSTVGCQVLGSLGITYADMHERLGAKFTEILRSREATGRG